MFIIHVSGLLARYRYQASSQVVHYANEVRAGSCAPGPALFLAAKALLLQGHRVASMGVDGQRTSLLNP